MGWSLLQTRGGSRGNPIAEYAYLPNGEPVSYTRSASSTTYYYAVDLRGNVVGLADPVFADQQMNYGPWGDTENSTGSFDMDSLRLGWKGNMWEGGITQLYYVHNRWYDPTSRGFISEDPTGLAGGINTYAYANNDGINGVDPDGLNAYVCRFFNLPATYVNGQMQSPDQSHWICSEDGGGGGGPNIPAIGPAHYPLGREPHTTGPGAGALAKIKSAAIATVNWLRSDCGKAAFNLAITAAADVTLYAPVSEGVKAARAGYVAAEKAATQAATYHGRVLARMYGAASASAYTNARFAVWAAGIEYGKGQGESGLNPLSAESQAAGDEWLPGFTDFIPFVDLVNGIGGVVDNCF